MGLPSLLRAPERPSARANAFRETGLNTRGTQDGGLFENDGGGSRSTPMKRKSASLRTAGSNDENDGNLLLFVGWSCMSHAGVFSQVVAPTSPARLNLRTAGSNDENDGGTVVCC